jgi:hypothetical protein
LARNAERRGVDAVAKRWYEEQAHPIRVANPDVCAPQSDEMAKKIQQQYGHEGEEEQLGRAVTRRLLFD